MAVIVDANIGDDILLSLEEKNIKYYKSFNIDYLYTPVNTHPDMQIHFVDDVTAVAAPIVYDYYKNLLPSFVKVIKGKSNPGSTYPYDIAYNVAKVGKKLIGKLSCVDDVIKDLYLEKGYEFIDVRQGYTKCNICIVDENSVITEDEGIFNTLMAKNIDVLKIQSGCISLPGFKNGFVGGASGFISEKTLAFYGDLTKHPDYKKMKVFFERKDIDIIQLSSTKICDFGSILHFRDCF